MESNLCVITTRVVTSDTIRRESGSPARQLFIFKYKHDKHVPMKLTYIQQSGSPPVGDGGDQYTGLDRFGRVVD